MLEITFELELHSFKEMHENQFANFFWNLLIFHFFTATRDVDAKMDGSASFASTKMENNLISKQLKMKYPKVRKRARRPLLQQQSQVQLP